MKFQFDAHQEYQIAAIKAVADLFDGQPRIDAAMDFSLSTGFAAIANRLELSESALLQNLATVQRANCIPPEETLQWISDEITTDILIDASCNNFRSIKVLHGSVSGITRYGRVFITFTVKCV